METTLSSHNDLGEQTMTQLHRFADSIRLDNAHTTDEDTVNHARGMVANDLRHIGFYFNIGDIPEAGPQMDWSKFDTPASQSVEIHIDTDSYSHYAVVFETELGVQTAMQAQYVEVVEEVFDIDLLENPEQAITTGTREWPVRINCPEDTGNFIVIAPIAHLSYPVEENY
jgi:hypothetical protein